MKKIKPIIQRDLKDCGVCSMLWIINYYDGFVPLEKLREDTKTTINGTTAYHIVEAFKKWGFDSCGIFEKNILNYKLSFPLIAHFRLENGLEHFVVVKKIIKNTIYIMDPGVGYTKVNITKFNKLFTGNIIIATPRDKIIKMDKGTTISNLFLKILIKEKSLIINIITSSIFSTILIILSGYYLKFGSLIIIDNRETLKYVVIAFGIMTIIKVSLSYIRDYYINHLNNLVDTEIYPEFIKHIFFLPLKVIKSRTSGEIMTRIEELSNIKSLFSEIFVTLFLDFFLLLASLFLLLLVNKSIFTILLIFIIMYILFGIITSKIIYNEILNNITYNTNFNSYMIEGLNNYESIKNLNVIEIILSRIERKLAELLFNNYNVTNKNNIFSFLKDFQLEVLVFTINSYGLYEIVNNRLNIVDLFTINIIIGYIIEPLKNMISIIPKFNYIKASFSKISEFINIDEENLGKEECLNGDIVFKKVAYSYNNYNKVLDNINFEIKKGDHVLLDGPSGSGKSTICKLIYKINDSYLGDIYIGNSNLKDISISSVRNNIVYISQNEGLFFGSIRDNIVFDRNISVEYFNKICKICCIDMIIESKNMRYDSVIDPDSKNISGGEKQRIILARGLLKRANIIILDEALSEVDKKIESLIIDNICKYFHEKTIIYISHKNQQEHFKNIINIGVKNG